MVWFRLISRFCLFIRNLFVVVELTLSQCFSFFFVFCLSQTNETITQTTKKTTQTKHFSHIPLSSHQQMITLAARRQIILSMTTRNKTKTSTTIKKNSSLTRELSNSSSSPQTATTQANDSQAEFKGSVLRSSIEWEREWESEFIGFFFFLFFCWMSFGGNL